MAISNPESKDQLISTKLTNDNTSDENQSSDIKEDKTITKLQVQTTTINQKSNREVLIQLKKIGIFSSSI